MDYGMIDIPYPTEGARATGISTYAAAAQATRTQRLLMNTGQ